MLCFVLFQGFARSVTKLWRCGVARRRRRRRGCQQGSPARGTGVGLCFSVTVETVETVLVPGIKKAVGALVFPRFGDVSAAGVVPACGAGGGGSRCKVVSWFVAGRATLRVDARRRFGSPFLVLAVRSPVDGEQGRRMEEKREAGGGGGGSPG